MNGQAAIGAPAVLGSGPNWRVHEIPADIEMGLRKRGSLAMRCKILSMMVREPATMSDLLAAGA